jgi:hypothetical protein
VDFFGKVEIGLGPKRPVESGIMRNKVAQSIGGSFRMMRKNKGAGNPRPLHYKSRFALALFFHRELYRSTHFAMELQRNVVLADHFDWFGERNLALVDGKALGGECVANIG